MTSVQIEQLQQILSEMFPDLSPGLILFELEIPVSRSPNWNVVLQAAIRHADQFAPKFSSRLKEIKQNAP